MDNKVLDLEEIIINCGVGQATTQNIIQNIANLEEFYDSTELVNIYNYILTNVENLEVVLSVIRFADSYKAASTLSILLDILLCKRSNLNKDDENFINVRVMAIKAISNYKNTSTLGALLYCLNNKDENYKIRLACADALGRIGDRYAVESLIDVVKDEEEKSVYVKESATFALGLLGDTSAIDPLVSILETKRGIIGKFSFLKEKIIEALGKLNINNKKVFKVLKESLYDASSIVRINAIEALMNSEYEEAQDLIRTALKDEDEEVQRNALIALYNMIGRDILDEVISLPSYSNYLKNEAQSLIDDYENNEEEEFY